MNKVIVSGNLTRDPFLKSTPSGTAVLTFGMAVNDRRRNQSTGDWEEVPCFLDVVMFGKRTEWLSRNLAKGGRVIVEGKLNYSTWNDKQTGQKRSKIEVFANDIELVGKPKAQQDAGQPDDVYESDIPF